VETERAPRKLLGSLAGGCAAAFVAFVVLYFYGTRLWSFIALPLVGSFGVAWLVARFLPTCRPTVIGFSAAASWIVGLPTAQLLDEFRHRDINYNYDSDLQSRLFNALVGGLVSCWIIGLAAWAGARLGRRSRTRQALGRSASTQQA
jgi:hypothetical protein